MHTWRLQSKEMQQLLHDKHKLRFQEEFDKYGRAARVNRSEPMQAQQCGKRLGRSRIPELFPLMLNCEDAKPPTPLQLKMKYHA